jgi:hypothetical protein
MTKLYFVEYPCKITAIRNLTEQKYNTDICASLQYKYVYVVIAVKTKWFLMCRRTCIGEPSFILRIYFSFIK